MSTRKTSTRAGGRTGARATGKGEASPDQAMFPDARLEERDLLAAQRALRAMDEALAGQSFDSTEALDAYLAEQVRAGRISLDAQPSTPLEAAQQLIYDAAEKTGARRLTLARRALKISPDCADAYVMLAEAASERGDQEQARTLYEQGFHAGERALGVERFSRDVGRFWDVLETRPYMRARMGLAVTLWMLGDADEAITHAQALIQLNASDDQQIRVLLVNWLLVVDEDEEALYLLARFPEDEGALRAYTLALLAFRDYGRAPEATKALRDAVALNPQVPLYLLELTPMPEELPYSAEPDDERATELEALYYVVSAREAWLETHDAMEWLAAEWRQSPQPHGSPRASARKAEGGAPVHGSAKERAQGGDHGTRGTRR
jgi:tetratricopeptide (TPR) repeat protein